MPRELPLSDHPRGFREFFHYWQSLAAEDCIPDWDVVPAAKRFPDLISHLFLIDVRDPPQLYIRLAGSAFHRRFSGEMTGRDLLDSTPPEQRAMRYARYKSVVEHPCGIQNFGRITGINLVPVAYGTLLLPVRRGDSARPLALGLLVETPRGRVVDATPVNMPVPERTVFIDIGAGVPGFDPQSA